MANYKKYAENLIGNWEKDIYVPQQKIAQEVYQTNWDKLTNDLNVLKDQLARNFENAKMDYSGALSDIQDTSFNRMNAAYNDLAARGLSASGEVNDLIRADTSLKGQEADKALSDLMGATQANISGLTEGVNKYGASQTSLATDLAKDLGKLTDADAANNQQYANLVGGIAENAAQRAASRAASSSKSNTTSDADELERRLLIYDTINNSDLSDIEKQQILVAYADVPMEQAKSALSAYNYDIANAKLDKALTSYSKASNFFQKEKDIANKLYDNGWKTFGSIGKVLTSDYNPFNIANSLKNSRVNAVNKASENLRNYTYGDIYNILYGNK